MFRNHLHNEVGALWKVIPQEAQQSLAKTDNLGNYIYVLIETCYSYLFIHTHEKGGLFSLLKLYAIFYC